MGGFSIWLADQLVVHNIPGHVYTLDNNPRIISDIARSYPSVSCLDCNVNSLAEALPYRTLSDMPHPWLIIEDCHVNTLAILEFFSRKTKKGDYFVIEDTYPEQYLIEGSDTEVGSPKDAIESFLKQNAEYFRVDSYYTDYFGVNAINENGYIVQMKRKPKDPESVRLKEQEPKKIKTKIKPTGKSFRITFDNEN